MWQLRWYYTATRVRMVRVCDWLGMGWNDPGQTSILKWVLGVHQTHEVLCTMNAEVSAIVSATSLFFFLHPLPTTMFLPQKACLELADTMKRIFLIICGDQCRQYWKRSRSDGEIIISTLFNQGPSGIQLVRFCRLEMLGYFNRAKHLQMSS